MDVEEHDTLVDKLWFLKGICMPADLFEKRIEELSDVLDKQYFPHLYRYDSGHLWLHRRIVTNANKLLQCWAYSYFHLEVSRNVGYVGHRMALAKGVFRREANEREFCVIYSQIADYVRYAFPGQVRYGSRDLEPWFYRNCWLVGYRDSGNAGSSMISRVLDYADYKEGATGLAIDQVVGNGYFCSTLEDDDLRRACDDALTREGALGYELIRETVARYRERRGALPYRAGFWCYNSFRNGIDLAFKVNVSDVVGGKLVMQFHGGLSPLESAAVDGYCRFRLEDIIENGHGGKINNIRQGGHGYDFYSDSIETGYELLLGMLDRKVNRPVGFAARVSGTLHPLINTNDPEFECARLVAGVWVVGYDACEAGSSILQAPRGGERIYAFYQDLRPTREEQPFSFGELRFQYKSSSLEKSVDGLDRSIVITVDGEKNRWRAFTGDYVQEYSYGEPWGAKIERPADDTVAATRGYVFVPRVLRNAVENGRAIAGANWKYMPKDQSREEVAITGIRRGRLELGGDSREIEIAVDCPVAEDLFWLENAGLVEDARKDFDRYGQMEPYRLCMVSARCCANGVAPAPVQVTCRYQNRNGRDVLTLSDESLVLDGRSWLDCHKTVTYDDKNYTVQEFPLKSLFRKRNEQPCSIERDSLEISGKVKITVTNKPAAVLISKRGDDSGVYVPEGSTDKNVLLVSERWICVPGEMCEHQDLCKLIDLASLDATRDGWHSFGPMLEGFACGSEVNAVILDKTIAEQAMCHMALLGVLAPGGTITWERIRTGVDDLQLDDVACVERKLSALGVLSNASAFSAIRSKFLNRDLCETTFHLSWRSVPLAGVRELLGQALSKGINFLALGDVGAPPCTGWYRKTWLSGAFVDLCHANKPDTDLRALYSFEDSDNEERRVTPRQKDKWKAFIDRWQALMEIRGIVEVMQGTDQMLSAGLASYLLEGETLKWQDRRGNFWPVSRESLNEFQMRTKSWRCSGVLPLRHLSRNVGNTVLDNRIWPLKDNGRGFTTLNDFRNCFTGSSRISDICNGPLQVQLGTADECKALALDAKKTLDALEDEHLRKSCVTGVVLGMLDHVCNDVSKASTQTLNAELLLVAVLISRLSAFLNGRVELVSGDAMKRIQEIIAKVFPREGSTIQEQRAWKLVMFYAAAVDVLVWFGSKVDGE